MDHMRDLLRGGELVALASDLAGSLEMTMLGRRVSAGSGAARLAAELEVPLVPVQAIADAHAPAILAWPEGLMEPLERWRAVAEEDVARFGVAPVLT